MGERVTHRRKGPIALAAAVMCVLPFAAPAGASNSAEPSSSSQPLTVGTVHALMAQADPVHVGDGKSVLAKGDMVFFKADIVWEESVLKEHHGKKAADGSCVFTIPFESPADQDVVIQERELARDNGTCVVVTEEGETTLQAVREEDARRGDEPLELPTATTSGHASAASSGAWHRARHQDPLYLTVNSVTNMVRWSYSGSCVTSSTHDRNYFYLSSTGWNLESISTSPGRSCGSAWTYVTAKFYNGSFCISNPTTRVSYHPNRIIGYPNGTYSGSATYTATGGCSSWLDYNAQHGNY